MTFTVGYVRELVARLLHCAGLPSPQAEVTATSIVLADWWDIGSHGLLRVPYYLSRLEAGGYATDAALTVVRDSGAVVALDGGGGLGHWQMWDAAEIAAQRCEEFGVAAVAVGNSGHCGALGVYTGAATRRGLVSLVFSHGPAAMPAWGGSRAVLSTSPFAAGIPLRPRPAVIDMALSAVARGTVAQYAQRGEPLEDGWAYDASGSPTTDPGVGLSGMLSPLGGPKGYALAFLVEALTAGLVGPMLSADVPDMFSPDDAGRPQRIAHLLITLDPAALDVSGVDADAAASAQRLERLAADIEASGGRVPGRGRILADELDDDGELAVEPTVLAALSRWAAHFHLSEVPVEPVI